MDIRRINRMTGLLAVLLNASVLYAGDEEVGGCCYCDGCTDLTARECATIGGTFLGVGVACLPECLEPVDIADLNLRRAIVDQLGGCVPTPFNMQSLTSLNAADRGIINLSGIEHATNLSDLSLSGNLISNLTPLSAVPSLGILTLQNNLIHDLQPLSQLPNLTLLLITDNQVSSLEPLANATFLTILDARGNQISCLEPLQDLVFLTALALSDNDITELSPLSGLVNLGALLLDSNNVTKIGPLSSLPGLQQLWLDANDIESIAPLQNLTGLADLTLTSNLIEDIGPLEEFSNLARLWLTDNPLSQESHCTILPIIIENNPGLDLMVPRNADGCLGACCLYNGMCSNETPADCEALGGVYRGDGTSCAPGSCQSEDPQNCGDGAGCCDGDPFTVDFCYDGRCYNICAPNSPPTPPCGGDTCEFPDPCVFCFCDPSLDTCVCFVYNFPECDAFDPSTIAAIVIPNKDILGDLILFPDITQSFEILAPAPLLSGGPLVGQFLPVMVSPLIEGGPENVLDTITFDLAFDPAPFWMIDFGGAFADSVSVRLNYDATDLLPGVSEDDLAVYRTVDGDWTMLPSVVDAADDSVVAVTNGLSLFALGVRSQSCAADLTLDGLVNAADLAILLDHWGPNPGHPADIDGNATVGPEDLALLLDAWGSCSSA